MSEPAGLLPPDDSPEAALDADLHSLGDDEYFEAVEAMDRADTPFLRGEDDNVVDHREGVRDERDQP